MGMAVSLYRCMYVYLRWYVCMCTYGCMVICVYVRVWLCGGMFVYMYVYVWMRGCVSMLECKCVRFVLVCTCCVFVYNCECVVCDVSRLVLCVLMRTCV